MSETSRGLALSRLMNAIHRSVDDGDEIPCLNVERSHWWLSDNREQQEAAIHGCKSCPALAACRRYVEEFPETAGTWAGKANGRTGALAGDLR